MEFKGSAYICLKFAVENCTKYGIMSVVIFSEEKPYDYHK